MRSLGIQPWYRNPLRWSDEKNDHWWGPFTFSTSKYRPFCIMLSSWGDGEDDNRPCNLRLSWFWGTLIIRLPKWLLQPHITKVYPADWTPGSEVVKRLGRNYYNDIDCRSYGVTISNSGTIGGSLHMSVHYGRAGGSSMDSTIERRWSCFLPWTEWRHIRISYYDLSLEPVGTIFDKDHPARSMLTGTDVPGRFDVQREMEKRVPKQRFRFKDFDGEELVATTHVEEREWRRGTGWFKWMSLVWPKIVRRSLDIQFSGETGKRKGSWKGGTRGHSIKMRYDDTHFQAFVRYCKENNMEFLGWETGDVKTG